MSQSDDQAIAALVEKAGIQLKSLNDNDRVMRYDEDCHTILALAKKIEQYEEIWHLMMVQYDETAKVFVVDIGGIKSQGKDEVEAFRATRDTVSCYKHVAEQRLVALAKKVEDLQTHWTKTNAEYERVSKALQKSQRQVEELEKGKEALKMSMQGVITHQEKRLTALEAENVELKEKNAEMDKTISIMWEGKAEARREIEAYEHRRRNETPR